MTCFNISFSIYVKYFSFKFIYIFFTKNNIIYNNIIPNENILFFSKSNYISYSLFSSLFILIYLTNSGDI